MPRQAPASPPGSRPTLTSQRCASAPPCRAAPLYLLPPRLLASRSAQAGGRKPAGGWKPPTGQICFWTSSCSALTLAPVMLDCTLLALRGQRAGHRNAGVGTSKSVKQGGGGAACTQRVQMPSKRHACNDRAARLKLVCVCTGRARTFAVGSFCKRVHAAVDPAASTGSHARNPRN